jgi:hypothetical protein
MPKADGAAKFAGSGPDAGGRDTDGGEAGTCEAGAGGAGGAEAGCTEAGAGDAETGAPKLGGIMRGLSAAPGCFPACRSSLRLTMAPSSSGVP